MKSRPLSILLGSLLLHALPVAAAAPAEGVLYIVHSHPVDLVKEREVRALHVERQLALEKSGVLLAAGGAVTEDGARIGITLLRAASFAEARAIADADPMHQSGARRYEIRAWTIKEGQPAIRHAAAAP